MDEGGYPSAVELNIIRNWPNNWPALMEYVESLWRWNNYFEKNGSRYYLSTGGWSGNEEIIGALKDNQMFWIMCWYSSKRGGHYQFEIKEPE